MAWTSIVYKCGHNGETQMYGPCREREQKVRWYRESVLCPDCREEKSVKDRKAMLRGVYKCPPKLFVEPCGKKTVTFFVTGDTYPIKEDLKKRGYGFVDDTMYHRYSKGWDKTVSIEDMDEEYWDLARLGIEFNERSDRYEGYIPSKFKQKRRRENPECGVLLSEAI